MLAVQFLYSWAMNRGENLRELARYANEFMKNYGQETGEFYKFARELVVGTVENLDVIDELIEKNTKNWSIQRIAKVDLAILRLAIYEMLFRRDIPPIVSVNEAIELGKELSTGESSRFINGVLDNVKSVINRPARTPDR
ncbi:MAG: transcription antitermination factor NusB [Puniceicoccales bacterium]|jgi:N utilization substance protein B|nr:transcription antitermination factor NusB [Puniceicoccales bacterium]